MFMKMRFLGIGFVLILIVLSSCGDYNKIVKSTDYEFKYKKAIEYYEEGEYVKAGTLFNELVNIYRGTTKADKIYYYRGGMQSQNLDAPFEFFQCGVHRVAGIDSGYANKAPGVPVL